MLLPFVWRDIGGLFAGGFDVKILLVGSVILFAAVLLEFEALKRGKIAVMEPLWSLEIPTAGLFAFWLLGERMTLLEIGIITSLIVGLFLVSFRGRILSRRHFLERGVYFAIGGALIMGIAAFFTGWSARLSDPLMANFAVNVFLVVFSGVYLLSHGRLLQPLRDIATYPTTILPMAIADNAAWVAYAFALTLIPIGIATALSESYIIIAVILGLAISHERLGFHQKAGLVIAIAAAITLAALTV